MAYLKQILRILLITLGLLAVFGCGSPKVSTPKTMTQDKTSTTAGSNIKYAGARSSSYGIKPFPAPTGWKSALDEMTAFFPGSEPAVIWIVGQMGSTDQECKLFFPGKKKNNIVHIDYDKHEPYLQLFDKMGVHVFLQVEPACAKMDTLIDLVLSQYGHHKSVIGFGIDVEWYNSQNNRFKKDWGSKITDAEARRWEQKVKSYNKNYKLFLKHWDPTWMPPTYKGDIVFVNDSQELKNLDAMTDEFSAWADRFAPNEVWYQIGYKSDKPWWSNHNPPPQQVGKAIAAKVKQDLAIIWVDFTLREVVSTKE